MKLKRLPFGYKTEDGRFSIDRCYGGFEVTDHKEKEITYSRYTNTEIEKNVVRWFHTLADAKAYIASKEV